MKHRIDTYFQALVENGGSDLHLSEGQPPKIRIHGSITPIEGEGVLTHEDMVELMQPICPPKLWKTYEEGGDADFAYEMDAQSRFRCNYMKQQRGYCCVFRLIPTKILTLEQLNVPEQIKRFGEMRSGLVLVTGPTGSGKSTTLAALIDYINTNFSRHIITVEEPIEFVHPSKQSIITQREVPENCPTFADGLRASLREDSDIVLVGEMRDLETISLALTAAETGLLVFGTLHTNNARKTIDRIIDVFPTHQQQQTRVQLAMILEGVISQALVPAEDGRGRVAAFEVMFGSPAIRSLIRDAKTHQIQSTIQTSRQLGMITLDDHLYTLYKEGSISRENALIYAQDQAALKKRI